MKGENAKFIDRRAGYLNDRLIKFSVRRETPLDDGAAHPAIANLFVHTQINDFDFALDDGETVLDANGNAFKQVALQRMASRKKAGTNKMPPQDADTNVISAYYLPFRAGQGHTMQLGNQARVFFTPALNGCTFVCGLGAQPQVSHLNLQNAATQIDQPAMDAMAQAIHGGDANRQFTVRRADYKPAAIGQYEDYQAVIVGFWINNAWRFYLQRYRIDFQNAPHTHQLRDVAALN